MAFGFRTLDRLEADLTAATARYVAEIRDQVQANTAWPTHLRLRAPTTLAESLACDMVCAIAEHELGHGTRVELHKPSRRHRRAKP